MAAAVVYKKERAPDLETSQSSCSLHIPSTSHTPFLTSTQDSLVHKMSPKDITSEELWKKAAAKGYQHGVHRAEDRQRKKKPCGPKTRYDQDCALKYYEKCV